jgi:hypothetical protein
MKKVFIASLFVLALSIALAPPALAGGVLVHGDKAIGDAYQNFYLRTDNPPFDSNSDPNP